MKAEEYKADGAEHEQLSDVKREGPELASETVWAVWRHVADAVELSASEDNPTHACDESREE